MRWANTGAEQVARDKVLAWWSRLLKTSTARNIVSVRFLLKAATSSLACATGPLLVAVEGLSVELLAAVWGWLGSCPCS